MYAARNQIKMPASFWKTSMVTFFLFGISDYIEMNYRYSILTPGGFWLLAWKVLCVLSFLMLAIWYIRRRFL
jgi:hypothetical protein